MKTFLLRDLCKTPPFAQFRRLAQILILEILNVFLWLKFSPSLNVNEIEHFSKVSSRHQNDAIPFDLPDGVTAACLNRSRRGGAKHGIFLIESSGKKWVIKHYDHKRGRLQRQFMNLENYLCGQSGTSPQCRFHTE